MRVLRDSPFRWRFLPYCFTKLEKPGQVWLPLNRHYKPLGHPRGVFVDYSKFANQAIKFSRNPCKFSGIWETVYEDEGYLYLYNDGTNLDQEYFPRLTRLLAHEHTFLDTTRGQNFLGDGDIKDV